MAEAFLRDLAEDRFDISSAGYEEATEICPDAVEAMREAGIDTSRQHPKKAEILPGAIWRLKWPVENPAAAQNYNERRAGCAMKSGGMLPSLFRNKHRKGTQNGTQGSGEREIRAGGFARQFGR
jgi:hypothetical protein